MQRRNFVKNLVTIALGASLPAVQTSCQSKWECKGVPLARSVDGKLDPNATAYFTARDLITNELLPVNNYDDPFADVVNESTSKAGVKLGEHTCIRFAPIGEANNTLGNFNRKKRLRGLNYTRSRTITIDDKLEPTGALCITYHEIGHDLYSGLESIPELFCYHMSTILPVNFPAFGKDTNYLTFATGHGEMLNSADLVFSNPSNRFEFIAGLSALLAVNEHNGSFTNAHNEMMRDPLKYTNKANDFMNYCFAQPPELGAYLIQPDYTRTIVPLQHCIVANDMLGHIVSYQIRQHNVVNNQNLDPITQTELDIGMIEATRFRKVSSPGSTTQAPNIITYSSKYKPGITLPPQVVVPANSLQVPAETLNISLQLYP